LHTLLIAHKHTANGADMRRERDNFWKGKKKKTA